MPSICLIKGLSRAVSIAACVSAVLLGTITAQAKPANGTQDKTAPAKIAKLQSGKAKARASSENQLAAANICERAGVAVEFTHKMPRAILVSLSMAETGRASKSGEVRPWPWTINAEGKGYYFETKQEAIAATKRLLKSGMRSIDVGCMQVNLRYHPNAFASLEEAFDPITNMSYGATFLKDLYGRSGSWPKAVAHYHSQLSVYNKPYFARVIRIWMDQRVRVASLTQAIEERATVLRGGAETPIRTIVIGTGRQAPMVLDANSDGGSRVAAVETVGLRFSIDEYETERRTANSAQPEPRVLEPERKPTVLAEASVPPA